VQFLIAFLIMYFTIAAILQRFFTKRPFLAALEREILALGVTCLFATLLPVVGIPLSNPGTGEVSVSGRLLYESFAVCLLLL